MAETLDQFFKKRIEKDNAPLMLDEQYLPQGTVTFDNVDPKNAVPIKGYINPQGKAEAKIPGMQVGGVKSAAKPVSDETAKVAAETPPITEDKVENLRKMLGMTNPVSAVSYSETIPSQPVESNKIDLKAIRDQVEAEGPKTNWSDLLVGLIPAAVDVATGGYGQPSAISGEYLLGKVKENEARKNKLEDFLLQTEKARAVAGAKKSASAKLPTASNLVPVERDGKVVYEWAGKAAGMEKPIDQKKGLTLEDRLKLQAESQKFRDEQEEKRKKIAAGARFQQKLESDKDFIDYKAQARSSQRALELLAQGKGVSDAGTRTVFAKGIFGDVGNIAVQEAAAVSGSPQYLARYETLRDMWFKGTRFSDQDRADLISIATMIRDKAPGVITKIAEKKAEAEKNISGVDVSSVAKSLSKDVTSGEVMVKVIYNGRIKEIPIGMYPQAVKEHKVKIFTGKE